MAVEPYRTVGCPPITAVGVTTADRPEPLGRCLSSLMRQLRDRSADIRIIIVDGSKKPANESLNRSLARSLSASSGRKIVFIGSRERRTFTKDLHAICPSELVEFAVAPGASGNRNLAVLLTSGENVLLVDDDVVCDVWKTRSSRSALELAGHVERRDIAFFRTRAGARRGMIHATANLLDAHQTLLGRPLQSLGSSMRLDATRACRFLIEGLTGLRPVVVRTTFSGLTGDAGASNPERLLFGTGKWKHLLQSGRDVYDTAFNYREVRRVANRYLVTHEAACMNEPGSAVDSPTRRVELHGTTVQSAARYFTHQNLPRWGLTVGLKAVLASKEVWLLANGPAKAGIIQQTIRGEIGPSNPASLLRRHPNCSLFVDEEAGKLL